MTSLMHRQRRLIAAMVATIAIVVGVAFYDEEREARATIEALSETQQILARSLAMNLEKLGDPSSLERRSVCPRKGCASDGVYEPEAQTGSTEAGLRPAAGRAGRAPGSEAPYGAQTDGGKLIGVPAGFDIPGELVVVVGQRGSQTLVTHDQRVIVSDPISNAAMAATTTSIILPREQAATFALPRRRAIASIAPVGTSSRFVAVVSSAQRERDRQRHSTGRLIAGVVIVTLIVLGFGTVGLREQRRELELQRDAQLVRADKMATVAALAGGVAHEIATPLGVIAQRAEQLTAKAAGDTRAERAIAAILEQTRHIEQTMRAFLSLARGEAQSPAEIDCAAAIHAACNLVEHRFTAARVELETHIAEPLPRVLGDATMLEHVVVNLLLNACEASPAESTVTLTAVADKEEVRLTVLDQGPGIDVTISERLGQSFVTTKPSGTGLGLAIANEVVNHHGGTLRVEPTGTGRGTRATVMLPPMKRSS